MDDVGEIIQASLQLNSTNTEEVQVANDFLCRWQKEHDSLMMALEILKTNQQVSPQVVACSAIKYHAKTDWFDFLQEERREVRDFLLKICQENSFSYPISKKFIDRTIALIGIVEFQSWETFFIDALSLPTFDVLLNFTSILSATNLIQNSEKQIIRYSYTQFFPNFIELLLNKMDLTGLEILTKISAFLPMELLECSNFFRILCTTYIHDQTFQKEVMRIIYSFICLRPDASQYFTQFEDVLLPNILLACETSTTPITCLASIIHQQGISFYITHLDNEEAILIFRKSLFVLSDSLKFIGITRLYWTLWSTMIDYFALDSSSDFLVEFYPILFDNFVKIILLENEGSFAITPQAILAVQKLYQASPEIITTGLENLEMSSNLIGILTALQSLMNQSTVEQHISDFFEYASTTEDSEIYVALLLCLQNSPQHISSSQVLQEIFVNVISFAVETEDEQISNAAVTMLVNFNANYPEVVCHGPLLQQLYEIINLATAYSKTVSELFILVVRGIRRVKKSIPVQVLTKITQGPLQQFVNLAGNIETISDEDERSYAISLLSLVQVIVAEAKEIAISIGEIVVSTALNLITTLKDYIQGNDKIIDYSFRVLLSMILSSPQDRVLSDTTTAVKVLAAIPEFSGYAMRVFALIRKQHLSISSLFEEIFHNFINPAIEDMGEDSIEAFNCLREFHFIQICEDFPTDLVKSAISNIPFHGISTVITFIEDMFHSCPPGKMKNLLEKDGSEIIDIITTIITDNFYDRFFSIAMGLYCRFIYYSLKFNISITDILVEMFARKMAVVDNSSIVEFVNLNMRNCTDVQTMATNLWKLRTLNMCGGMTPQEDQPIDEEPIDLDISTLSI
ncbi:hypothetical protein TVAG_296190 [Trichomonas vaginalis G3]|uniref:Importin N-terminal domain-containing protein n=1 Tax=Trichomonas vaginalis (strain ATCC PRA-98 / G3) TaxID=412133 RepID=A2F768_TRIV3|nr:armadillo (ARM) repeat-containing protein family [Trichomonas vaginalis G3]EAX99235.1 hypothetical protein TVAG_296190 [Trichomonas vaginalis G3]KAI5547946.1 armadillo (ARM) repeat-containing protein family [Trichomonas vaginalis G3]|eukprot:XP_001312165.1 hypothetical protein [Trichomonas vaginalis G3]